MRNSKYIKRTILATTVLVITTASVTAQSEIVRSTVDGGGALRSTGGAFELSGTIGQPDAGKMSSGPFQLTGGFWFEIPPTDCNEDGAVNLLDHSLFSDCLTGPGSGIQVGCNCFDVNRDGAIDLLDMAMAQIAFSRS